MTRKRLVLIVVVAVAALTIPAGLALGFFTPLAGDKYAHPPCEQLPSRTEVAQAIAQHASLVDRLTSAGDGVDVIVGEPCPGANRALVTVRVATEVEEASVREVLGNSEGFGVASIVERG